jgi:hypothetical protein
VVRAAAMLGASADLASIGYVLGLCSYLPLLEFHHLPVEDGAATRRLKARPHQAQDKASGLE